MAKASLSLQTSEGVVVTAAATIYAAYLAAGRVDLGKEKDWMQRSVQEALWIARITDELVQSDKELP